jgi:hypothetical protein
MALPLQSRLSTSCATPPVHFALVILEMGILWTICPDWPQTAILISASQVTRIIGISHWRQAATLNFGHTCNPNVMEAEARGSQLSVQHDLHSKTLVPPTHPHTQNPQFCPLGTLPTYQVSMATCNLWLPYWTAKLENISIITGSSTGQHCSRSYHYFNTGNI